VNALRFITCGRAACRQMFFLCSHCDRGQRYCGIGCRSAARRASVRAAGQRYQATPDGKHAHAWRQRRYREQPKKVTHHPPEEEPAPGTVAPATVKAAIPATDIPVAARTLSHGKQKTTYRCALCSNESRFLRHETLARYRPRRQRRP
jgi:hypothetical protein